MNRLEFKKDKYRKARGGYSRFLKVSCERCGHFLALYQKDGPGPLKRMYLDRIFAPGTLVNLKELPLKKIPPLRCQNCKQVIGLPFLYKKEERHSFRLFEGSVSKKIVKVIR